MSRIRCANLHAHQSLQLQGGERGGGEVPSGKLSPYIVRRAYQSSFCQGTAEDHELA